MWGILAGKILLFLLSLAMVSCLDEDKTRDSLSQEIRKDYKKFLKPLPKIDYLNLTGSPPTDAELELGRMLFNDTILSRNNDVSCASCHLTNHGFADGNDLTVGALGAGGPHGANIGQKQFEGVLSDNRHFGDDGFGFKANRKMFRNSLSTINVAYRVNKDSDTGLLWDGRFGDILFQILLPIHTPEELCGYNPLPLNGENIFKEGGPLFDKPVTIQHSHFVDTYTGKNENLFNYKKFTVKGIPRFRKNGSLTIPNRNECLALAIAKLRKVPEYRELFKKAYGNDRINDKKLASALSAFVLSHVSKRTPYDKFVKGENTLSSSELKGMAIFFNDYGKEFELKGEKLKGMGCVKCHAPPTFDSHRFETLGIVSDEQSSLARPQFVSDSSGFFNRPLGQRGRPPECHKEGKTFLSDSQYAPDLGRASATFSDEDCFKFRVPTLRNVLSTFPYFHHGTEKAQSHGLHTYEERAMVGLKNAIKYHLRGPISPELVTGGDYTKVFFDEYFQRDLLIPYYSLNFGFDPLAIRNDFTDKEIQYIYDFIAKGLYDEEATIIGDLGNDVTHPRRVPSGFFPSVTRDRGHQFEISPNMEIKKD
jgi:cytochrome c peroxidase